MRALILVSVVIGATFGGDKDEKEKKEIINQYLINDGFKMSSEQFFEKQIHDTKNDFPDLPDSVWDEVRREVHEEAAFLNGVVELYMTQFSIYELREIKKSMDAPAFKKYREYMESKTSGNDFGMMAVEKGRQVCLRITDYLKQKNYIQK